MHTVEVYQAIEQMVLQILVDWSERKKERIVQVKVKKGIITLSVRC